MKSLFLTLNRMIICCLIVISTIKTTMAFIFSPEEALKMDNTLESIASSESATEKTSCTIFIDSGVDVIIKSITINALQSQLICVSNPASETIDAFEMRAGGYLLTDNLNETLRIQGVNATFFKNYGEVLRHAIRLRNSNQPTSHIFVHIYNASCLRYENIYQGALEASAIQMLDWHCGFIDLGINKHALNGATWLAFRKQTGGLIEQVSVQELAHMCLQEALRGDVGAMVRFEQCCRDGIGVPKNELRANYWQILSKCMMTQTTPNPSDITVDKSNISYDTANYIKAYIEERDFNGKSQRSFASYPQFTQSPTDNSWSARTE